jgi:hypothetical protein
MNVGPIRVAGYVCFGVNEDSEIMAPDQGLNLCGSIA